VLEAYALAGGQGVRLLLVDSVKGFWPSVRLRAGRHGCRGLIASGRLPWSVQRARTLREINKQRTDPVRRSARRVMGTTVIGGILAATFLAIFLIPVTYYVVEGFAA